MLNGQQERARPIKAKTGPSVLREILQGASLSLTVRVVGVAISYGANILMSRALGLQAYGEYVIALSWVMVLTIVARAGFDNSALRYSSIYFEKRDLPALRGFIRFASLFITFASLLSGLFVLIAGSALLPVSGSLLLWTALLVLPLALTTFYSVVLRTARRIVSAQSYEQVVRPGLIIVGLAILSLGAVRLSPSSAMALTCAASFLTLLAVFLELRRVVRFPDRQRPHYGEWHRWLAVSLPLLMMGAVQELMNQVDIILLGQMADARQAALFAASWRLASLVPFALVGLATIAGPLIAAAHDRGAIDELHRVSRIVARIGLLFALMGAVALFAFARPLLALFGSEFVGARDALLTLLLGGIANAFAGVVAYFMTLTGHERQAFIIFAGALVISILLNLLLIPRFGALGSAVASSSATAAWNMTMLVYVRRTAGIDASALALPPRTRPGSGDLDTRDA